MNELIHSVRELLSDTKNTIALLGEVIRLLREVIKLHQAEEADVEAVKKAIKPILSMHVRYALLDCQAKCLDVQDEREEVLRAIVDKLDKTFELRLKP